jgi:hypothetical protein
MAKYDHLPIYKKALELTVGGIPGDSIHESHFGPAK